MGFNSGFKGLMPNRHNRFIYTRIQRRNYSGIHYNAEWFGSL